MYDILDAHFLSVVIVVGSIMVTPIYVMAVYVFSGASAKKGCQIGGAFLIWGAIIFIILIGMADFLSAFFFGFTSSEGSPLQLFRPAVANRLILFPTGMIPFFLVPYAIFFHFLSLLNYRKFQSHKPDPPVGAQR